MHSRDKEEEESLTRVRILGTRTLTKAQIGSGKEAGELIYSRE